jgi:hypothetical protein
MALSLGFDLVSKEELVELNQEYGNFSDDCFHSPRMLLGENVTDKALKVLIGIWRNKSTPAA